MIDYHLHLWPHGEADLEPTIEELARYVEVAKLHGVVEIAITEHLFRFSQAEKVLGKFFRRYPDSPMRRLMENYWRDHAKADLDKYVEVALAAKSAGLPVVVGLEVDYYQDKMDVVKELLKGYPFDVLLGSVHWIQDWPFDHVSDEFVQANWDSVGVENAWDSYTRSLEELSSSQAIDVLAHPDLVKVAGRYPAIPEEFFDRMAQAARDCKIVAEVSSAGYRKPVAEAYPAPYLLRKFKEYDVKITTASDAHRVADTACSFSDIKTFVTEAGYLELAGFKDRTLHTIPISGKSPVLS